MDFSAQDLLKRCLFGSGHSADFLLNPSHTATATLSATLSKHRDVDSSMDQRRKGIKSGKVVQEWCASRALGRGINSTDLPTYAIPKVLYEYELT